MHSLTGVDLARIMVSSGVMARCLMLEQHTRLRTAEQLSVLNTGYEQHCRSTNAGSAPVVSTWRKRSAACLRKKPVSLSSTGGFDQDCSVYLSPAP